ncbi:MAG: (d)CMP kinase [Clostridiales bacterium]
MNSKITKAIAIDGPSGAGKSTVARLVAEKLGFQYIDTGAMYRGVTLKALMLDVDVKDEKALTDLAANCTINLVDIDEVSKIFLDGKDVSAEIRGTEVTENVSQACSYIGVREAMVEQQRAMAASRNVVMDGRDIGTHVLPNALLKIYLTASAEERGRRRFEEWQQKHIGNLTLNEVIEDLNRRDHLDSTRKINPLKQGEDAILLNSDGMEAEDVADAIISLWKGKEQQCFTE